MNIERFDVRLGDGRVLEAQAAGPADGTCLIQHHGTPGDGSIYPPVAEQAASRGLRTVTYTRPGYGRSTRHEGRSVADCAADAAAVADHLGADRFFTMGASGGGPHALACAARLPDRTIACATVAGVAPWGAEGLDFLEGMAPENHEEFRAALAGADELHACLEGEVRELQHIEGSEIAEGLGELVSAPDVAVLAADGFGDFLASSVRAGVTPGDEGWFDDDVAFVRGWGFELTSIRVPVRVWQGEQDRMVPAAHGRWLAGHIPGAALEIRPDDGHLSIGINHAGAILDALLDDGGSR